MQFTSFAALAWPLVAGVLVRSDNTHGQGDEGTIMGPVAFLWPDDRKWDAAYDNAGPCGSPAGVTNRTTYPLSQGSVALSVADDAWQVAFYIAFSNNPTSQSDFQEQLVQNVTEIVPGHQCYKIAPIPGSVTAGTNATIQLQYWATYAGENNGKNESFYACSDITFVEDKDFGLQVPCFNVTSGDFGTAPSASPSVSAAPASSSADGLSGGAKAGIAVGTIVGSLAVVGVIAFLLLRKRRSNPGEYELSTRGDKGGEASSARSH